MRLIAFVALVLVPTHGKCVALDGVEKVIFCVSLMT